MTDVCSAIARAILYEGYVLWPYRRSALKNRQRWTFGGVYPPAFAAASGGVDRAVVRAQCVAEIREEGRLEVCARFLHVASRRVLRATPNGLEAIDELSVDDRRVLSWEEAIEREARVSLVVGSHGASVTSRIEVSSGSARDRQIGRAHV